jgi:ABC-type glycerol-3-phosphate transport system substrate-binding protein
MYRRHTRRRPLGGAPHRPARRFDRRLTSLGVAAALGAGLLSGCAQDAGTGSPGSGGDDGGVTLSVGVFGVFGYKQAGLYDEYERLHPEITIKENSTERNEDYYPALLNHLTAGAGLQDIQAVEVGNINELATVQADKFVDLSKSPGVDKGHWLDWKWNQAKTEDSKVIGLGTDIGPMAVCYRKDLFEEAGLPTDRAEVSKLWAGDWGAYVEAGEKYAKDAPSGTSFMDSAGGLYNGVVSSYAQRYYDESGEVVYQDSKAVRTSWDLAMRAVDGGLSAKLKQFDTSWDQAFANGDFATVVCPPWMLGYIKEKAGERNADAWDVAQAPRPGNWGGSFLTVPTGGEHQEEAVELAAWLTAPEQQAKLFQKQASFPSSQAAFELPEVKNATHEYFGGAPIGEIFAEAAEGVPTQILGPKDQIIAQKISEGVLQAEQQGKSPGQAWDSVVDSLDNALG